MPIADSNRVSIADSNRVSIADSNRMSIADSNIIHERFVITFTKYAGAEISTRHF